MASKTKATESSVTEAKTEAKTEAPAESIYTREELANSHKVFGTYREIVDVALRMAGKDTATLTEAKAIVEKFKNKEVK